MKSKLKQTLIPIRNRFHPSNSLKISRLANFSSKANMLNTKLRIAPGNTALIESGVFLRNLKISIRGKNNELVIRKNSYMSGEIELFGDNNSIEIGKDCRINGAFLGAHHGTKIAIGNGCLFSTFINIRTTDSHFIFNAEGRRINPNKDIIIHDRVWLGREVTVLKGVEIESDSIVGTKSLVTGFIPKNTISGGVPARVLKTGTTWKQ